MYDDNMGSVLAYCFPAMGEIVFNVGGIKSLYCYIYRIFDFESFHDYDK